ncbi:MAG: hypothetical protein KIT58_18560 [Planctomycetota bacterium]|nr:hypothetical protein [Planctomycetota bacterium]
MIFDKLWKIVVSVAVVAALIGVVAYFATRETRRTMTPLMHGIARDVTQAFARDLPRSRDVNTALFIVAGRGPRDEEQQFQDMLFRAVEGTSKYRLTTWDDVKRQLGETWTGEVISKLGLTPGQAPSDLDRAVRAVTHLEKANIIIDGILFVDVAEFTEGPDKDGLGARIALKGQLYSLQDKKVVADGPKVSEGVESALDPRYVSYRISQQSLIGRFLLFFILAAGLPWAGIGVVRRVVKMRRNEMNGLLLAGFTAADLLLFWVVVLALGTSGTSLFGLLVVAGLMGYYNFDAMDYIGRRLL